MAEAFLGLKVSLSLHSGIHIDGTVAHIEPETHQMTLHDVSLLFPGQPPLATPIYGVVGSDIKDLLVVSTPATHSGPAQATPPTLPPHGSLSSGRSTAEHYAPSTAESSVASPRQERQTYVHERDGRSRKTKSTHVPSQSTSTPQRRTKSVQRRCEKENGWAEEDVEGFRKEEFDFQANLSMFDKEKVFAEIRETDDTASDALLVSINRLPSKDTRPPTTHLLPTEMVLDPVSSSESEMRNSHGGDDEEEESDSMGCSEQEGSLVEKTQAMEIAKGHTIYTTDCKSWCPTLSLQQMANVEQLTAHENPYLSLPQMVENGGRSACVLAIQLIDLQSTRDYRARAPDSICVMVSQHRAGAYGMAMARHLINRGYLVTVYWIPMEHGTATLGEDVWEEQVAMLGSMGHSLVQDMELVLSPANTAPLLVVDALGMPTSTGMDINKDPCLDFCKAMDWIHSQSSPVLSLGMPAGVHAETGIPWHPSYFLRPQWTLCLGVPMRGCTSSKVTGELYMADLGIPMACWKKAGLRADRVPWGADFLVALRYIS
ncbi:YjeF N-terminal domain-containing protein [Spinellus fusiger]|nr:YjeF N-terminal domain-containing protein [Spinellus fusiger]